AEVNARRIGLEDTLVYKLSFRGIDAPLPPELRDLPGFQVLHRSHSSTFEFAGGRSTHTSTFLFYLKPLRPGRQEIPAAHTVAAGREYRTAAFTIEVVPGRVLPASARPQNPFMPLWEEDDLDPVASSTPAGRTTAPAAGEIRLEAVLSKKAVLVGEPVVYSVRLLTQRSVDSVDLLSSPSFPGFWQEWLPVPTSVAGKTEIRGGKTFQVFEIRKAILFPSQPGTLEIPALAFSITADGGPLALFSGARPLERATPPLRLPVKPLPPAAKGLPVGRFRIQAIPDRERADAGEFFSVHLTVTGDGNVKTIAPPTLAAGRDYRTYPAKVASRYDGGDPPCGTLTAEIPVAFLRTGQVTFPAVEFRFYDPAPGRVESARTV
ncbi:MAG TPA: BatD family protein, partial [Candidatus Aminicenantes bacterium]|nr:BatD family protein [Candidatus Aminicenantes bacterium]